MSRAKGRRVASRREETSVKQARPARAGRPVMVALTGVLAVVVGAGALVWAGRAPVTEHTEPVAPARMTAVARDFTCAGRLPGAKANVGVAGGTDLTGLTVDDAAPAHASIPVSGSPVRVHATAGVSARAFAMRTARTKTWYAAGVCPSPRSTWWFVGAGGSEGHHTELTVANPRKGDAIVDINVFGPHGVVKAPGLDDVRIASGSVSRFDLRKVAPAVGDLAVRVVASRGLVTASAAESWSADYVDRPVLDWVTAQPAATRKVTIGGLPADTSDARLLITNPTAKEAVVHLLLEGEDGTFAPTAHSTVRVRPGAVRSVALTGMLKADPHGIRLASQVPVTGTVRVRRGDDAAYLPVVGALGGSSVLGIPAHTGAAGLVLFGTKGSRASRAARVVVYDASGGELARESISLHKDAATTYALPAHAASVVVRGATAAGALMLGADTKQSFAVVPLAPTGSQAKVPVVSPRW